MSSAENVEGFVLLLYPLHSYLGLALLAHSKDTLYLLVMIVSPSLTLSLTGLQQTSLSEQ